MGYSVCMGHDISNGNFCLSDDNCASKKCLVEFFRGSASGMCRDAPTPAPTLPCTSSDCMKKCRAASDCGQDERCTVVFRTSGPWGAGYSVCIGCDIPCGHFCMGDDDCASKKCSVQNTDGRMSGMCMGEPTTCGQPSWIGWGLSGAGGMALGLIIGCAVMWLRWRHSEARDAGSGDHSLIRAFPDASAT